VGLVDTFGQVVNARWFLTIDLVGTVAFALSGITIARSEGYSMFGAFLLAALPAVGGGIVMDWIAGRDPIAIVAYPSYIVAILAVVLVAKLLLMFIDVARGRLTIFFDLSYFYMNLEKRVRTRTLLVFFDSIGLASFTVTAVFTAIQFDVWPVMIWGPIFAVLNGAFGAVLRDVFRADAQNPIMKGSFYAEIACFWAILLTAFVEYGPGWAASVGIPVTLVGVSAMRMLFYGRNIRAPMF
jgi:uncharacterized membrane protein YeiH